MGGVLRNSATGEDRYFYDDQVSEALSGGWAPVGNTTSQTPTGEVVVHTPEQRAEVARARVQPQLGEVDADTLSELVRQRNLETVHGDSDILAGAEGALSAVSLGGSDWLLDALGADTAKRAEANPLARSVGEIGATIGTTILTGGLGGGAKGLIGKALTKTPLGAITSRTGRLAAKGFGSLVAAETLEGMASGAGGAISTLALRNEDLTAEAALAELGHGVLMGGLVGAGAGVVAGAASKVARVLEPGKGLNLTAPEAKQFTKSLDDLGKVIRAAGNDVEVGYTAVPGLRKAVKELEDIPTVKSMSRMGHDEAMSKLTKLDEAYKAVVEVNPPEAVAALESVTARVEANFDKMAGIPGREVDKIYREMAPDFAGFEGPAAHLHRAWLVDQATRGAGGKLAEAIEDRMVKIGGKAAKATKHPVRRMLENGIYRLAGHLGRRAAGAVMGGLAGGPIGAGIGAAVSGMAARGASDLFRAQMGTTGFLSAVTGGMLNKLSAAAKISSGAVRTVGENVGTIVRRTSFSEQELPAGETPRKSYDRLMGEVTSLVSNPNTQTSINDALGPIREASWGVGDKLEVRAMEALSYLAKTAPKDPGQLHRWGMSTWRATDAQVHEWLSRVAAVRDPANSLTRFMRGGGSPAEADAIKNVYPSLFAEFQKYLLDNLVEMRDKVPAATRVRLAILSDAPVDSRLRPEFRTFMKEHWVARAENQKPLDVKAGMAPSEPTSAQKLLS